MNILVTGGAGFIGSHLVEALVREGHSVTAADNFDPFYDRSLKRLNLAACLRSGAAALHEVDICDRDAVMRLFEDVRPEAVVHLAARAGVRPSLDNPLRYAETNVTGTVHLLDASVRFGVRKFVFASSSSVYGRTAPVPFSEEQPALEPASPYAATKAAGEALCASYSGCYGLPAVALRLFTVYGPRQRPDLAIHKFTDRLLRGEPLQVYGDGTSSRDYTYVGDIVSGIVSAIHYCTEGYSLFNLGNDRPVPLLGLIRRLEDALGVTARLERLPEQTGDMPHTWANIDKARRLLDYRPDTPLEDGLSSFISWKKELPSLR